MLKYQSESLPNVNIAVLKWEEWTWRNALINPWKEKKIPQQSSMLNFLKRFTDFCTILRWHFLDPWLSEILQLTCQKSFMFARILIISWFTERVQWLHTVSNIKGREDIECVLDWKLDFFFRKSIKLLWSRMDIAFLSMETYFYNPYLINKTYANILGWMNSSFSKYALWKT